MAQPKATSEVISEVYPSVMRGVLDASRVDFEDAGISGAVLDELQSLWQQALSDSHVGTFPWDTLAIKFEPILDGTGTSGTPWVDPRDQYSMSTLTQAQLLPLTPLERYHAHLASHQENLRYAQEAARQKAGELARMRAEAFVARARVAYADRTPAEGSVPGPASIGAPAAKNTEWRSEGATAYLEQVRNGVNQQMGVFGSASPSNQQSNFYRSYIPNSAPGDTQSAPVIKSEPVDPTCALPLLPEYHAPPDPCLSVPQLDGDDDELNDGDDENVDTDNDEFEEVPELCVCLYDKVIRNRGKVSHKWKCVLRDGVLIAGGKEYLFGKANGEFVW